MPAASLKALADRSGTTLKRAEHLWDKAKTLARKQGRYKKDGADDYYAYVTGIVKRMMSLDKRTATASASESAMGLGVIVADLEQLKQMEAPVKFTHPESGSTITLASDGTLTLQAKGDVKINLKQGAKIATASAKPSKRGEAVAAAIKGKAIADKLTAKLRGTKTTAADDDGDESKKWEGIASAIITKLGSSEMTLDQIAEAIGRDKGETEECLKEMQAQNGAAMNGEKWSLTIG